LLFLQNIRVYICLERGRVKLDAYQLFLPGVGVLKHKSYIL